MTPTEFLDAAEAKANAATEGPWFQGREGEFYESERDVYSKRSPDEPDSHDIATHVWSAEDAEFIAHARQDVPALVSFAKAVLAEAEWHETKAEKARQFPGVGREAAMAKAAQVHDDAAAHLRTIAEKHLGSAA